MMPVPVPLIVKVSLPDPPMSVAFPEPLAVRVELPVKAEASTTRAVGLLLVTVSVSRVMLANPKLKLSLGGEQAIGQGEISVLGGDHGVECPRRRPVSRRRSSR